jgi:hypothetical protein
MTSILEQITGGVEAPPAAATSSAGVYDAVLTCAGWGTQVGLYYSDEEWKPALGYGGHPIAARPKTSSLTVWEGRQPFQMVGKMILSQGAPGDTVPDLARRLDQMASAKPPTANQATPTDPYTVTIAQTIGALPLPGGMQDGDKWWIEDLAWGDGKRNASNELYYKEVVITLLETVVDETLKTKGAHPYTIRKGDTWAKIAAQQLGDQERQFELREMNGTKTDAQLAKMVGKTIRIPQSI